MPQSHCAESTPEWGRIDNTSLFEWSFLVILGHSSNDNDNDNQFEQCSSHPCCFGRLVRKFWTCSKSLCTQQCPARILFISLLCALKTCSYLLCRTDNAPVPLSRIYSRMRTNVNFLKFVPILLCRRVKCIKSFFFQLGMFKSTKIVRPLLSST